MADAISAAVPPAGAVTIRPRTSRETKGPTPIVDRLPGQDAYLALLQPAPLGPGETRE